MNTTESILESAQTPTGSRIGEAVKKWLANNNEQLRLWRQRADSRRRLLSMTDRELTDIGIDRLDAKQEAAKRFWEA